MGEQSSLEFDLTLGDVLPHKLVQAYLFWTDLLFVRHPLPGLELGTPTTELIDALDRSAMILKY